jgi:hypothetical protein
MSALKNPPHWVSNWILQSFTWLCVWVLPTYMFDGCVNRNSNTIIDSHFTLLYSYSDEPILQYHDYANPDYDSNQWQIKTKNDSLISDLAIIGSNPPGSDSPYTPSPFVVERPASKSTRYFIIDRRTGTRTFYLSEAERDQQLWNNYHMTKSQFREPGFLMMISSNCMWPWNSLYYAGALLCISCLAFFKCRRLPAPVSGTEDSDSQTHKGK